MKISSIHLKRKEATTFDWDTGFKYYEITNMLNDDGIETNDTHAVKAIVVKDDEGKLHTIDIQGFVKVVGL